MLNVEKLKTDINRLMQMAASLEGQEKELLRQRETLQQEMSQNNVNVDGIDNVIKSLEESINKESGLVEKLIQDVNANTNGI